MGMQISNGLFHYKKKDLPKGIDDVITVGDFYKLRTGEGVYMLFI
jgi:hypothetical protein